MKKIGLVGEDPNDTTSIKNLLDGKHPKAFQYKQLLKNARGHQLNNKRVDAALKIEFEEYNPHCVIFIRDSDSLPTEKEKIQEAINWFYKLNDTVNKQGIFLLNIYELEALILADISTFNKEYKTTIKFTGNVMYQKEPKEFLIHKTFKSKKTYTESHCPELFKKLSFDLLIANCKYFFDFHTEFKRVTQIKE